MSVSITLTLPSQPAAGVVRLRPLGGDGYSSPQSMYIVDCDSVSDASGGVNTITVNLDPQYQSVISLIATQLESGTADVPVFITLHPEGLTPSFGVQKDMKFNSDVGSNLLYAPPPMFNAVRVLTRTDNVDTETLHLAFIAHNFKRDAFQKVPLNIILASLPRGFDIE